VKVYLKSSCILSDFGAMRPKTQHKSVPFLLGNLYLIHNDRPTGRCDSGNSLV